jgi:UDP-N-acetylmuramate: L-alanyl-gamma-D-glutamyl-meso-diaminopimelate ligase
MRIHFIAIGGAAMHNLAIALHRKGAAVSGSDDEIFDPSKSRLEKHGLLPQQMGWNPELITEELDAVILGMHAHADNPELAKAKELGLAIYSYPEYVYEQTKDKTRVVIGGSHGKTTITSMILHVLQECNIRFDYLVGAQLEGFDCMVGLHEDTKVAIIEGDEYLSSPIDRRPKFHLYQPDIAVISGIAWDHMNVFPTFENYVEQFEIFTQKISDDGHLIYCEIDPKVKQVAAKSPTKLQLHPYGIHPHRIENGITYLPFGNDEVAINIFGDHNLQNLNAAKEVCLLLGVSEAQFYQAISNFAGAARRLEHLKSSDTGVVYKDFAHSPSKLQATTSALKGQFPKRRLLAVIELHTFSSLNKDFLDQYQGTLDAADEAYVYFSPDVVKHKRLPEISVEDVSNAFACKGLRVFTDTDVMRKAILERKAHAQNLLLMSSGHFGGWDLNLLAEEWLA